MLLPAIPSLSVCCVAWFLQFTGNRHCFNWPKYYKNITKYFPSHFMFANIQQLVIWRQEHSSSANGIVKANIIISCLSFNLNWIFSTPQQENVQDDNCNVSVSVRQMSCGVSMLGCLVKLFLSRKYILIYPQPEYGGGLTFILFQSWL